MSNNYNKDLYKVLGVGYDATLTEIKVAYRRLVRKYHPDVSGECNDARKFKEIQTAYEVLSSTEERKKYDIVHGYYKERLKRNSKEEEATNFQKKYNEYIKNRENAYKQSKNESNEELKSNKSEKKESFSQSISDALDSLFHTQNNKKSKANEKAEDESIEGEDIQTEVTISAKEAAEGTIRKINILHTEPCSACLGRKIINGADCVVCKGTGQIQTRKKINVKIPKGVKKGAKVRVKKEGNRGQNGGKDGDLYLIINIEKDKYIKIEETNVYVKLPITITEAVLGADISFKLFKETISIKIPPLTSSGQEFRLTGQGLENNDKKGDVIVIAEITIPETITEEEKILYEKLKDCSSNFDIRKEFNNER